MKSKKRGRGLFTAALTIAAAFTAVPTIASAAHFTDIQENSHETAIIELVDMGLIYGYPDGTFKPNKALSNSDVVKLVGRYLVQNGFKVPADYKTNLRFSDLSTSSENGLLQYAALLKDKGIFNGENGKMNPSEQMTRENMAVVLVNTLSAIHEFDYLTYVSNQAFQNGVEDLNKAAVQARPSINVLDYYDITNVAFFNPKATVTRGQFATFLYTLTNIEDINLSIAQVEVLSNNQLLVTLSDQSTHNVTLSKPLIENSLETVAFKIDGIPYTVDVKYEGKVTDPEKEEPAEESRFKVESDEYLLGITQDGRIVEADDANIKVFGYIDDHKVELPYSAFTITTNSEYLSINGGKVTANFQAIQADGVLNEEEDQLEAEVVITINDTGETIKHTLKLTRKEVKANDNFKIVDNNSIRGKEITNIYIDSFDEELELTVSDLYNNILAVGSFEIIDQYGNDYQSFNPATGEVTFFDGSTRPIQPIISNINTIDDEFRITSNGTNNIKITGLSRGDSFNLKLSIDEVSLSIKVYIR